jgi:hypothetical protein
MVGPINMQLIEGLCPELRLLLSAELAIGNSVSAAYEDRLGGVTAVWLARSFSEHSLPPGIEYCRELDPRDRFEQFLCRRHQQVLLAGLST